MPGFQFDNGLDLDQGQRFLIFNVILDFTKGCFAAVSDASIADRRVAQELTALFAWREGPGLGLARLLCGAFSSLPGPFA